MSKTNTLADYDMVLALSETTINYQFSQLHKRNIIRKNWSLLVGNVLSPKPKETPFSVTDSDKDWEKKLDRWIEIQRQIEQDEDYGLIAKLKEEGINFDFGWNAQILSPTVRIKDKDSNNLSLEISFKSGELYYRPDKIAAVRIFDLKGCTYAFNVPIGKLEINKDQMVLNAQDEMKKVIRENGLSEEDFSIESLFLNFENADITSFDKTKSKFPDEIALPLQVAIQNYFNIMVAKSENPYVLGYGVNRRKIRSSENAMFQPTSVNFSTSYSSKQDTNNPIRGQFSAFNFLMMLNNRQASHDQNAGVMSASLIELGKDTSATTDGVFAIQNERFQKYIDSMDKYVESIFAAQAGVDIQGGFKDGVMKAKHHEKRIDDTVDTVYKLTRQAVQNHTEPAGLNISYKFEVDIEVVVNGVIHTPLGDIQLIRQSITLSTNGQYTKGDISKKGAIGYLNFIIKNGIQGRFDLEYSLSKPSIAFDKDTNLIKGDFWEILAGILSLIFAWPIKVVEGIVNQIAVDLGTSSAIKEDKNLERLRNLDILNQTNRVILPLGKTYAYKNLRYLPEKGIVAYDIAYAPVIE